jgi:hypothetical protein
MKIIVVILIIVVNSARLAKAAEDSYVYDFTKTCGFFFKSTEEFRQIGEESKCHLYRRTASLRIDSVFSNNRFFPSYPFSMNLDSKIVYIERKDQPIYSHNGFRSEKTLRTIPIDALKKQDRDVVFVSHVESYRNGLQCKDEDVSEECCEWRKRGRPNFLTISLECWDGMFYGKDENSGVIVSVCARQKPEEKFASLDSWPARLIKSLTVSVKADPAYPSPSFNCFRARENDPAPDNPNYVEPSYIKIERTICDNPKLSLLDVILNNYYKHIKSANGNKNMQLLDTQRAWLKQRNTCETAQCLTDAYTRRIKELCEQHPESACPPVGQ